MVKGAGMPEVFFDEKEQECNNHICAAMNIIINEWKLDMEASNLANEMCNYVHGLQSFVIHHMLERLNPDDWGNWYGEERNE